MVSDLRGLLISLSTSMSEIDVKKLFFQMVKSIDFCHKKNVIHRDVKLENFLATTNEHEDIIVKLSDFGLACEYSPS